MRATPLIDQARIDRIRDSYRVSDLARRLTKLRRAGGEFVGLCPAHNERSPSFFVNDAKGFAHCFGCGFHADIISLAMFGFRLTFPAAVALIDAGDMPVVDPVVRAQEKAEDEARDMFKREAAQGFWEGGVPIIGTPAEAYLAGRRITAHPPNLRFGRVPAWFDEERGLWGPRRPALLVMAEQLDGAFAGIQRIFITENGEKAIMRAPKRSLGDIRGSSIRFGRPSSDVILTGGPEDGLTLFQRYAEQVTIYVSCGEAMMPFVNFPSLVRAVTIARQNDDPGRAAAKRTGTALLEQRRLIRHIAPPPRFKDWNDELCEKAIS